jgi:hypothetical protein
LEDAKGSLAAAEHEGSLPDWRVGRGKKRGGWERLRKRFHLKMLTLSQRGRPEQLQS